MRPRRVATLGVVVVLAVSGTYFFVYLWRWEWNRAIVAGIIFVAAEIGLALALLLDRLGRVESRLRTGATSGREGEISEISATIRDTAPPPRDHFDWLVPRDGGFGVFVPLLMGMGVIVSGLAWVVERIARVSAKPVLERRLAAQLLPLAWPSGGVSGDRDAAPMQAGRTALPAARHFRGVGAVLGLVALAGAVVVGVDTLGDLTQDRADSVEPGSRSRIVLEVETQDARDPSLRGNAERLWTLCQATVRNRTVDPGVVQVGDGRFLVVTEPAVGDHAWRRLQGCLEDMSIPRVNAKVVSKDDLAPPPAAGEVS